MSSVITNIDSDSRLINKVAVGDTLLTINGKEIIDVLDYKFHSYDEKLCLHLLRQNGETYTVNVQKEQGDDLGLDFETYLMDKAKSCSNRCIFCFVDQLPKGMRRSLYFKDDDARLSFLQGNYITLTNLPDSEVDRICALHIGSVNISVHATDPVVRTKLLGNPKAKNGLDIMRKFAKAGINMNCQIVCCPEINDGEVLAKSMSDLTEFYPHVSSVSIIPVGLTGHREGLCSLTPFNQNSASAVIDMVEDYASHCLSKFGSRIFFCADELYIKAGREMPKFEEYEDFPQFENGVGLIRSLEYEFLDELDYTDKNSGNSGKITIATGVSAAPFLEKLVNTATAKCESIEARVVPIYNDFFGRSINVSGLITGRDLVAQLKGNDLGERVLISQTMLRHSEGIFLDDMTVQQVESELNVKLIPVIQDGAALLSAMLND